TTRKSIVSTRKPQIPKTRTINPAYSFDSFVIGPTNSLARAAAFAVSQNLGRVYNPLYIYGNTGLGKTHLLHAIANEAHKLNNKIIYCYLTADYFVTEFINAIRNDKINIFRSTYETVDLLLLDDIQFLSNKEQTQEFFFHIFNSLYDLKKQIVLSSDTLPQDIMGLQQRIKSRLQSGLITDIQMPTLETRIAILKKKAVDHAIELDDQVATFLSSQPSTSIRELEGYLVRLAAYSSLMYEPISMQLAKNILHSQPNLETHEDINLEAILKTVAKHFNINTNEIKSEKRSKNIAFARQLSFYLMKKLTRNSLQTIGAYVGGRDHSTVIFAAHKIEKLKEKNQNVASMILSIETMVKTRNYST
ncbi:MAG TPA: chromosomal replication initiator protein DnaA, partial [Candidatus Babeliales bacterium]|nr:chromosomal replication initiator protein DnaA [Candidatus Babeliales bacterium]